MYEIIQALMALHGEVYDFLYKHITLFDKIRIKQPVITQLNQEILGNKCTKPIEAGQVIYFAIIHVIYARITTN